MKKPFGTLFALLLLVFILAACQAQTPVPATEAPTETAQPTATAVVTEAVPVETEVVETQAPAENAYPEPQSQPQSQSYPEIQAAPKPGEPGYVSAYPEPQTGDEIAPLQARWLMFQGEVTKLTVGDADQLTLTLFDGRELVTTQEEADAYIKWLEKCADPCAGIEVVQ